MFRNLCYQIEMRGDGHTSSSSPESTVIPCMAGVAGKVPWCFPFGLPIGVFSLGVLVEKEMLGSINF